MNDTSTKNTEDEAWTSLRQDDEKWQRFLANFENCSSIVESGCIEWCGSLGRDGYGVTHFGHRSVRAHRAAWAVSFGAPPPRGLVINHKCRNRACVNVLHLEAITNRENVMHPDSMSLTRINLEKTHCQRGHAYDKENTIISKKGWRSCRKCRSTYSAKWRARAHGVKTKTAVVYESTIIPVYTEDQEVDFLILEDAPGSTFNLDFKPGDRVRVRVALIEQADA